MTWPSVVATLVTPNAKDKLNSPSHSSIHTAANNEIIQIETFVGTLASTQGTLVYDIRSANSDGGGHVQSGARGGTGQTSYTKGDMLVAVNSSTLTKIAIGGDNSFLKANSSTASGLQWAGVPLAPTIRYYNAASTLTWSKPSTLSYVIVEVLGGGGGGGRNQSPAGGGGAGGYARKVINASTLSVTETVVVGAGGNGGTSGTSSGSVGGVSYFGTSSYVSGNGGGAGTTSSGGGGGGVGGDINISGEPGYLSKGGNDGWGGNSPLGYGYGGLTSVFGRGLNAAGFGAGGAGPIGTNVNGGNGTSGVVIVYEF